MIEYYQPDEEPLDIEAIEEYLELRPCYSVQNFDDLSNMDDETDDKQIHQRIVEGVQNTMRGTFVENSYIQNLFPNLKIQKPGFDFYSYMFFLQVAMCIYIIVWYPKMDAENLSITD